MKQKMYSNSITLKQVKLSQ